MKHCPVCDTFKPLDAFGKDASKPDGRLYRCKDCTRAYNQANAERIRESKQRYQENNPDKVRAAQQRYNGTEAGRESKQRYRENHREEIRLRAREDREGNLLRSRRYQERNREKVNLAQQLWRDANRGLYRLRLRLWKRNNPEKVKADVHARNAKKRANGGRYTAAEWEALKQHYNYTCLCCGRREPEIKLEVDHVVPVHLGGSNSIENLQPLCGTCNRSKGAQAIDYRPGGK